MNQLVPIVAYASPTLVAAAGARAQERIIEFFTLVFSFARIGAALADVYVQNRRLRVRLREKGGKRHEKPCHHNLETYLHAYLAAGAPATWSAGRGS